MHNDLNRLSERSLDNVFLKKPEANSFVVKRAAREQRGLNEECREGCSYEEIREVYE